MASPGNRHFASCIGTLSFSIDADVPWSLCLFVGYNRVSYKHGWADRHVVWGYGLGWAQATTCYGWRRGVVVSGVRQ